MDFKIFIVLLFAINCNAQFNDKLVFGSGRPGIRLPVVTTHNNLVNSAALGNILQTIPVRQFLSYPTLRSANEIGAYGAISPVLSRNIDLFPAPAPVAIAPPAPILERVATLGLTNSLTGGIALGSQPQVLGPVIAAIITRRTAEVVDVPTPPDVITPQVLIVEPNLLPVTIEFRSQSSPVNINQVHIPGPPGEFKETRSEEEPDRVLHEVVKPVIQEVREIIQPFRRITQQILPVQEEIHSVVARGQRQQAIQEVAIPPPTPIETPVAIEAPVAVAPQPVAVAAPIAVASPIALAAPSIAAIPQPITFERTVSVDPVFTGLAAGPALTGTVVRAGLIGGARIIQAPGPIFAGIGPIDGLGTRAILTGLAAQPVKREAVEEKVIAETSVNNRPNGPVKREVVIERLS